MSLRSVFILFALSLTTTAFAQLRTVPTVDPAQYAGTWYQIAANPEIFEVSCKCSRQLLTLRADNKLDVYNSCTDRLSRQLREIHGVATADDDTNARFTIDFGHPWKGQYWIIALADDYRFAVVSEPNKSSLFILSRTPTMTEADYEAATDLASEQVNIGRLRMTSHSECVYP